MNIYTFYYSYIKDGVKISATSNILAVDIDDATKSFKCESQDVTLLNIKHTCSVDTVACGAVKEIYSHHMTWTE